jgi:hypothetical protein
MKRKFTELIFSQKECGGTKRKSLDQELFLIGLITVLLYPLK